MAKGSTNNDLLIAEEVSDAAEARGGQQQDQLEPGAELPAVPVRGVEQVEGHDLLHLL